MKRLIPCLILFHIIGVVSYGQSMTSIDFSPWVTNSLNDTLVWNGPTDTNQVHVCVLEGNNHRNGYPGSINTYDYSYQEAWFQTWWDDAGVTSSTIYTPKGLSVWGGGTDTILFCFSKQVEGDSNFLYFHQVDFSNTQVTIQAYNCGVLLNHNLIELNESSGSPSFVTTSTQASFVMSAGANRRHLVRFNQDFDFVRVIENNSADLINLGFMGFGNVNQGACSICNCEFNPVLDFDRAKLEVREISKKASLCWNSSPDIQKYIIERFNPDESWQKLARIKGDSDFNRRLTFIDTFPNSGDNYYRIRYVDVSGREFVSQIAYLYLSAQKGITIFPNPSGEDGLFIQFDQATQKSDGFRILCIDQRGIELNMPYSWGDANQIKVKVRHMPSGLYFLLVKDPRGYLHTQKIQIQN